MLLSSVWCLLLLSAFAALCACSALHHIVLSIVWLAWLKLLLGPEWLLHPQKCPRIPLLILPLFLPQQPKAMYEYEDYGFHKQARMSYGHMMQMSYHSQPSYQPPTYQPQPTYHQPTYQQPTYQQPTYKPSPPTYMQPTYQQPSYSPPTYQQPSYQQPSYPPPSYHPPPPSYHPPPRHYYPEPVHKPKVVIIKKIIEASTTTLPGKK